MLRVVASYRHWSFQLFPSAQNWNIKISDYLDGFLTHREEFLSDCFRLTQLRRWIFKYRDIASQWADWCGAKGRGVWPKRMIKKKKKKVCCLQANIIFPFNLFNTATEFRIRLSTANAQVMYDQFKQYVVQIIAQIGRSAVYDIINLHSSPSHTSVQGGTPDVWTASLQGLLSKVFFFLYTINWNFFYIFIY